MRAPWETPSLHYLVALLATVQVVNGQGFMQIHAGDSQSFSFPQAAPTSSTILSSSVPYPMPNSTRLLGTVPLSGSGLLSNGGSSGYIPVTITSAVPANQSSSGGNCGPCQIRYPLVRVYYWPVNSTNTWCLSLNPPTSEYFDSATTSSVLFGGPQSNNSLGLPAWSSNYVTMPTDLPKLPTSPSPSNAVAAPSGLPTPSPSLNTATETTSTNMPKLSSSFSPLNAATETVPTGRPKLTPRDISHITPAPSLPSLPAELLRARSSLPLNHSMVYAVGPDGFIFTSPSVYVVISTIDALDNCGKTFGGVHTSLTLSFAENELSTIDGISGETMRFNFADLPCPPSSYVYDSTVPNPVMGNSALRSYLVHSYHPVILAPKATIKALDPAWQSCMIVDVGNGYDPPRPMTPVTGLWDNPTSSVEGPGATPTPAPQPTPATPSPTSNSPPPPPTSTALAPPVNDPSLNGAGPALPTSTFATSTYPPTSDGGSPAIVPSPTDMSPGPMAASIMAHSPVISMGGPNNSPSSPSSVISAIPTNQPLPSGEIPAAPPNPAPGTPTNSPTQASEDPSVPTGTAALASPSSALIVGGLTLTPAQPDTVPVLPQPQPSPTPVVVGSLTFSPANPNSTPAQPPSAPAQPVASLVPSNPPPVQAHPAPVTVGGLTFSPVQPGNTRLPVTPDGVPGQSAGPASVVAPNSIPDQQITVSVVPIPLGSPSNPVPNQPYPASDQPSLTNIQPNTQSENAGSSQPIMPGLPNPAPARPNPSTPLVVGGLTFATISPATAPVVQDGQTIVPVSPNAPAPSPPITVGGQIVHVVPPGASEAVVGSETFTGNPSAISIGEMILSQGAPGIVVSNTPVSLGPSGLIVGTSAFPLQSIQPAANTPVPLVTIGSQTLTANPTALSVAGTILSQGAPAITVSNTPVSLGPSGLVIGSSTIAIPASNTPPAPALEGENSPSNPAVFSVAGTVVSSGGPGITVSGTPVTLGPSGLIVGTSIVSISPQSPITGGSSAGSAPSVYSVASAALTQGGSAITISGTQISLGPSGLVVGSSTVPLPSVAPVPSDQVTVAYPSVFSIGGVAVTQGGPAVTISGTRISLGSSDVIIGTSTANLPSPSIYTAAGQTFTPNPTGFSIAGTTLTPGGPGITVSGTPISLGSSEFAIGTSIIALPSASPLPTVLTVAGQSFTPNPTGFLIAGTALTPGGPGITISGTPVSLGTSQLAVGTNIIGLSSSPSPSIFTVAGQTYTANPTGISIAGTTITPGGQGITISGTPVSLGPSVLVIGTTTMSLLPKASVFTVDGEVFTATQNGLAIDGKSVSPGGAGIIVSGTPISLGKTALVIGTSTMPLSWSSPGVLPTVVSDISSFIPTMTSVPASPSKPTFTTHVGSGGKMDAPRLMNLLYIMFACGIIVVLF